MKAIIFDIEEFSLYDGPGIRTTVFLKGCPLRCKWCHNPEGISYKPQLLIYKSKCIGCGECKKICKNIRCISCGNCVYVCPTGARKLAGKEITIDELTKILLKNKKFLKKNNVGITLSGGEPLMQYKFVQVLLKRLLDKGIHTAIETCGYVDNKIFIDTVTYVDLVLFDLKHTNSEMHKKFTGKNNELILSNLKLLKDIGKKFILRIPLIPGVNDNKENMQNVICMLKGTPDLIRVELLPYHKTAGAKYKALGIKYDPGFNEQKEPYVNIDLFRKQNIPVAVI